MVTSLCGMPVTKWYIYAILQVKKIGATINVAKSDSPPRNNWEHSMTECMVRASPALAWSLPLRQWNHATVEMIHASQSVLLSFSLTCIVEEISPAKPAVRGASWAITIRPVLHTDCRIQNVSNKHPNFSDGLYNFSWFRTLYPCVQLKAIPCFLQPTRHSVCWFITWATVSTSHGIMVLRSISSQDTPSSSLAIAQAERRTCIWAPYPTSVTSDPTGQHLIWQWVLMVPIHELGTMPHP